MGPSDVRWMWAGALGPMIIALACGTETGARAGDPPSVMAWAEETSAQETERGFAPGYDLVWIADEKETAGVELREDHVERTDRTGNVYLGPDWRHLSAAGVRVDGAVLGSEGHVVYSIHHGEIAREQAGTPRRVLWRAPWEIDRRLEEDAAAFYALLIDCRPCVPRQREQVWRIPKKADDGAPTLLWEGQGIAVTDLSTTGDAVYFNAFSFMLSKGTILRVPLGGKGGGGPPENAPLMPWTADARFLYGADKNGLYRADRRSGARQLLARISERPVGDDATDFYFISGDSLLAVSKSGAGPRLLAAWTDGFRSCAYHGSSRDAVALVCGPLVYSVPKQPRPRGRRVAYRIGDAVLALADDAVYWADGDSVLSRPRNSPCDVYDDSCSATVMTIPGRYASAVALAVDGDQMYVRSEKGGLWRVPRPRATDGAPAAPPVQAEPLEPPLSRTAAMEGWRSVILRASLVADPRAIFYLDAASGDVIRRDRATGARSRLEVSGLERPVGLALQGDALFVLERYAQMGPLTKDEITADAGMNRQDLLLVERDARSGQVRREVPLLPGRPRAFVATRGFVYVSLEDGRLQRLPIRSGGRQRGGSDARSASMVFPEVEWIGVTGAAFRAVPFEVLDLAAVDDALVFTRPDQIMYLRDDEPYPSVLASGLGIETAFVAADAKAAYFGLAHHHKGEHRIELGMVPLPAPAGAGAPVSAAIAAPRPLTSDGAAGN